MRTFWRRAVAREFVARDPMTPVARPKLEDKEADQLTDDELTLLLATTVERSRHAFRARRDRAIIVTLATTGMRVAELANLKVADVDLDLQELRVLGKGGRFRRLPILPEAHAGAEAVRGAREGAQSPRPAAVAVAGSSWPRYGIGDRPASRPARQGGGDRPAPAPAHVSPSVRGASGGLRWI